MKNTTLIHYEYKEEDNGELLTPWADPMVYEYPFDFHFATVREAKKWKEELAPDEEWVMVKVTTEIIQEINKNA